MGVDVILSIRKNLCCFCHFKVMFMIFTVHLSLLIYSTFITCHPNKFVLIFKPRFVVVLGFLFCYLVLIRMLVIIQLNSKTENGELGECKR